MKHQMRNCDCFFPAGIHVWKVWRNTNNETTFFVLQSITSAGMNYTARVSWEPDGFSRACKVLVLVRLQLCNLERKKKIVSSTTSLGKNTTFLSLLFHMQLSSAAANSLILKYCHCKHAHLSHANVHMVCSCLCSARFLQGWPKI